MKEHLFAYLFPLLLATALVQKILKICCAALGRSPRPIGAATLSAVLSAAAIFIPVKGIPLAGWVIGINANFSIPLTALLFSKIWQNATGAALFDRRALLATWIFGLAAGLALYPQVLGLGPARALDPYALGYGSTGFSLILLAITVTLLLTKNRFGVVLIAAMLAYDLRLLESPNLWDYIVDPFFAVLSLSAIGFELFRLSIFHTPKAMQ